jgi:hypothetical protein
MRNKSEYTFKAAAAIVIHFANGCVLLIKLVKILQAYY